MATKVCSKCKEEKDISGFCKRKSNRDGLYCWCRQCCAEHKQQNKQKVASAKKQWASNNRDKINAACARWFLKNKNKKYSYRIEKYATDIQVKMLNILRSRLSHALKGVIKSGSAVKDLGCSIEELKTYLESKFQPGMSWENHSKYGWHIDHIIPLSSFDLSDPEQLKKACHYTNLQPLWAKDNLQKSNKATQ
jgi:hypothetical protein